MLQSSQISRNRQGNSIEILDSFLIDGIKSTTNRALAIFEDNQLVKQRQITQKYSSQLNKYDNR